MFTARKRHLRKKRFFLSNKKIFALFNRSNLKTSKIIKIKLSLQNAKLYSVPLYLNPPKLGLGYPLIMVVFETFEDLQKDIPKIVTNFDCLGISINKKWYPIKNFTKKNITHLEKKILALLLTKAKKQKS